MAEQHEHRLKRLRMRSWHRGIKEMDLILGRWADTYLEGLDDATLDAYEAVLAEADQDLYVWVSGQDDPPASLAPMIARIAADIEAFQA